MLQVRQFEVKGRGVVATAPFRRGSFLLEYKGELISHKEGIKREMANDQGSYLFYFKGDSGKYSLRTALQTM